MTIQQLMDTVANLGFEAEIGDVDVISETVFFPALNKAVYKINEIRPKMGETSFVHNPLQAVSVSDPFSHTMDDIVMSNSNVISFSFKARGNGEFIVKVTDSKGNVDSNVSVTQDGETATANFGAYTFDSTKKDTTFRCFVGKRGGELPSVEVTFYGDFYYTVMRFAFFGNAISSNPNDVPIYNEYIQYSMPDIAEDFLSLQRASITDSNGYELMYAKDYLIKNDRVLLLPWDSCSRYVNVTYTRKLWQYSIDGATNENGVLVETDGTNPLNVEIDVDEDLAQLLPNLVAFYVLQDDEPQKAQNYYQIFLSEYNEKKSLERRTSPTPYDIRNTWG